MTGKKEFADNAEKAKEYKAIENNKVYHFSEGKLIRTTIRTKEEERKLEDLFKNVKEKEKEDLKQYWIDMKKKYLNK